MSLVGLEKAEQVKGTTLTFNKSKEKDQVIFTGTRAICSSSIKTDGKTTGVAGLTLKYTHEVLPLYSCIYQVDGYFLVLDERGVPVKGV
jgi:hypothetical protein